MLIKVEHLRKEFSPEVIPIRDLSCEIGQGDVISIIGPSGTGKSTFLNLLNRLEEPTAGKIWFDGEDTTAPGYDLNEMRKKMGMVFQSFNLFSHLTLAENIMLGPVRLLGRSRQQAYDTAIRLLQTVGLADRALSLPHELSGGQQQRAAIARAMAMEPKVLLLDEPTSALDPTMVGEVLAVIRSLARSRVTMLIVTHEMNFAREVSDRVFYLDEGTVYEEGTPEQIFGHPLKENTRRFIRKLKVLELNINSRNYDFLGTAGEINRYCNKNQIPWKTAHRVRLAFEELVQQILIPVLAQPDIQTVIEYSEAGESAVMTVHYNGPAFDVTEKGEELALKVLKSAVSDMSYTWDENAERPNQAVLHIRTA